MVELISIHIPKTGGTSFYRVLQQVYGATLSISYKRKDLPHFPESIPAGIKVLHGHFRYKEVQTLHETGQTKMICWLRDPAQRVYSNYRFFIEGLKNPDRNPKQYELNKHRIGESLIEYASLSENQNRMAEFLEGLPLEKFFFIGFLESFESDLHRLGEKLNWPKTNLPKLNQQPRAILSQEEETKLLELNRADVALFRQARELFSASL
ncbi:MAG: sulfotransferase family 2 domain-containing protein [Saprospiraceae bacterium]|nr:sulfotransferase family 2 domain-containing protein [Saprospiraceae bacterium]